MYTGYQKTENMICKYSTYETFSVTVAKEMHWLCLKPKDLLPQKYFHCNKWYWIIDNAAEKYLLEFLL